VEAERLMSFKNELGKNYSKAVVVNWAIVTLRGHSAMPGDILGCHEGGGREKRGLLLISSG